MAVAIAVQDATGTVDNANAYMSVAEFKGYHDLRGNDYSTFSDDQIATGIIRATDYIDTRFSFVGVELVPGDATASPPVVEQTTRWPRTTFSSADADSFTLFGGPYGPVTYSNSLTGAAVPAGIPVALTKACAEYAFRALTSALFVDTPPDPSGRLVKSRTDKVDVIESSVTYESGQTVNGSFVMPAYPQADLYLYRGGLVQVNSRTVTR